MDLSTQSAEFAADQLCDSVTVWLKPLKDQPPNSVTLIYYSIMIYDISSSGYRHTVCLQIKKIKN